MSAPAAPYVGLEHFREEDKDLFFGRDEDRKRIIANLEGERLTLLCAESGVGKTSLLHAGVSARLKELAARRLQQTGAARYLPFVFSGWRQGSTDALISELETQSHGMLADAAELTLPRDSLALALAKIREQAGATPLLILDRFEDALRQDEDSREFDDELARCVTTEDLDANFLLSVREDALSLVDLRLKGSIPNVLSNVLHLPFLDREKARQAIVGPIEAFNRHLPRDDAPRDIESELVEAVVRQVRRGRIAVGEESGEEQRTDGSDRVETAYLQLVMQRLWDEEVSAGSAVLRLSTLERLGGADRIVRTHLDDVMGRLPPDQTDAAAAAFRFLLTSGGRKIALTTEELRDFSGAHEPALEPALEHLERARILRPVPAPRPDAPVPREIFHDILIPAVLDWRRRHALAGERERARRLEVRSRRLAATAIALAAVLVGMGLYLWNPGAMRRLELATVDTRFALRGERSPDQGVLLVAVDDRTLRALAPPGATILPRAQHARLLRRVIASGPAVVALDVIFEEPATIPAQDAALLSAMRVAGQRLVLAYDPLTARAVALRDGTRVMRPLLLGLRDLTQLVRARFGYAGLPQDVDGRIRRADYQVTFARKNAPDVSAPTLAFAAADVARRGALRRGLDHLPTAGRRAWGGQSTFTTWIDMHGPTGTVQRISALDLLGDRVAPSVLRGRSVVIGVVPDASDDVHRAPLDGGTPVPGAELHAEALSTILRGSPVRDAHAVVEVLTIVLLGALPALAFVALPRGLAIAAVAGAAVAYLVAAQLSFQEGRVLIVPAPMAALALAALGIAALQLLRARRARSSRTG